MTEPVPNREQLISASKQCRECGETKLTSEFNRRQASKDHLSHRCQTCDRARTAAWTAANRERKLATEGAWRKRNPKRLAAIRKKAHDQQRKLAPGKYMARRRLRDAVKKGKIKKPERCEDCNQVFKPAQLHGHHQDYDKPLEVRWLCRPCHRKTHD